MQTITVNLLAGPSTGKSTVAALLFGMLKQAGICAELVSEYAKDLTWEGREAALAYQPYVTAKQIWRLERLQGKVDVVVTDSPMLLGLVYTSERVPPSFDAFVLDTFAGYRNRTYFLERDPSAHPYNPRGRSQTEEEAVAKDAQILEMLRVYQVPYETVRMAPGLTTAHILFGRVQAALNERE